MAALVLFLCGAAAGWLSVAVDAEFFPDAVDAGACCCVHGEHLWPGACEAFAGPFAGGVDAHFGAVVGQA